MGCHLRRGEREGRSTKSGTEIPENPDMVVGLVLADRNRSTKSGTEIPENPPRM